MGYGHETCGVVAAPGRVVVQPFLSVTSCHFMSRTLTCTLVPEPFVRSHLFFSLGGALCSFLASCPHMYVHLVFARPQGDPADREAGHPLSGAASCCLILCLAKYSSLNLISRSKK